MEELAAPAHQGWAWGEGRQMEPREWPEAEAWASPPKPLGYWPWRLIFFLKVDSGCFLNFLDLFIILLYRCFAYMYVCELCVRLVIVKVRWGCCIPWNWSSRWLWAAIWVLGINPRSSARTVIAFNYWANSPAPSWLVLVKNEAGTVAFRYCIVGGTLLGWSGLGKAPGGWICAG